MEDYLRSLLLLYAFQITNIEAIKSDAPFITLGCSIKSSVEFTKPVSLMHDLTLDKSSPQVFLT